MGPNYRWGPEKTIELLNAVHIWEVDIKGAQPKKSRKWQWVAAQLFVPEDERDVEKLSKRCERRVALLRAHYEAYFHQHALMEESLGQAAPPSPIRFDAAVWVKMIDYFGEPKIIARRRQAAMQAAANVRKSRKIKLDDDQDSEDEAAGAFDHGEPEESSSSSVGSNHSFQSSTPVFPPTPSSGSSYYEISGSDGHAESSEGLSKTTAMTYSSSRSSQSFGSSGHYTSEADISLSKTTSESSSHDETSITLESSSDDSYNVPLRQFQPPAAVGSVTGSASFSPPSVTQTAVSRVPDFRSLLEKLNSCANPSAAAAAARLPFVFQASKHNSSTKTSDSSPTESKSGSVCCSSAKYGDALCLCGGFSSGEKSTGQATGTGDRKQNSRSSGHSSMLGDMGSRFPEGEVKDKIGIMAAAAGEAGYGGPSKTGGISSSKTSGTGMVFYDSDQREPQYVRQLPASFACLNLNNPPSPEAGDGDDELANDMRSQSSRPSSKEHNHAQESGSQSSKPSSKEHPRAQQSSNGYRRVSPSSSSRLRDPSSSPEPSSSSSGLDSSGKDDNVNLMVYIKLNNLKLSEPG